jgi:hypothetical protein
MKHFLITVGILLASNFAWAADGTITMSGTLSPSYQLIIAQGSIGPTVGGTTTAATIGLGEGIAFYGTSTVTTGVTQSNTGDTHSTDTGNINLSFPVNIEVDSANSPSAHYTLDAALSEAAVTGTTVKMGGKTLTTTASDSALTTAGVYGTGADYTISLDISTSVVQSAGALGQEINITFTPSS